MADRYWVGGSGTWNTTSTTNWSATSGGAGGATRPAATDSVFFNQVGTYSVTMTGALTCLDITVSAGTVTFENGTTPTLAISGSLSFVAGTVWNTTGLITFNSNVARTITNSGTLFNSPITFSGVGGIWTLQSNLTLANTLTTTLGAGTLTLDTFTLTTAIFICNLPNARTINFGTGKIALVGTVTATIWNTTIQTSFTTTGSLLVE